MAKIDIEKIVQCFRIRYDNQIPANAIMNILLAQLNNIFAFKKITFESCENYGYPYPLSFFCWNFLPSGAIKSAMIKDCNKYLFSWFDEELDKFNKERYSDMCCNHTSILSRISDKAKDEKKRKMIEFEKEEKSFINFKANLKIASQSKIYQYADIIDKENKGSLFFIDTEAGKSFEIAQKDNVVDAFFKCLLDLYDGDFYPLDTTLTDRNNLKNLPATVILSCDYSDILEDKKILKLFKKFLKTGMARRTFFYCPLELTLKDNTVFNPEDTEQAINNIRAYYPIIKDFYNKAGGNYTFSLAANVKIKKYKQEIKEKIIEQNKYNQKLTIEDEIIQIDLKNSTWKIIKLATLLHLLKNPSQALIETDDLDDAIEIYNQSRLSLQRLIKQKATDIEDELFSILIENINKLVSFSTLRQFKIVNNNKFSKWINDEAIPIIIDMCKDKGLGFELIVKDKNSKFLCVYDNDHKIEKGDCVKVDYSDVEVHTL